MIRINQIKIPVQKDETSALKKKIQKTLRTNHPYTYQIVRKSLDARDKGNLLHIYTVDVEFERSQDIPRNIIDNKNIMLTKDEKYTFPHRCRDDCNEKTDVSVYRPVIIGAGPAGYFAALQLACAGYRPIVYERGKCVEERTRDVEGFWQGETPICANSNVSFGEGGAGTFSDGKLNTGIKDKYGRIQAVIHDFIRFGASEEIGYLNKPHIGTDVLKHVMKKMREEIQSFGGEIHFSHQLTAISHRSDTCLSLTIKDLQNEQTIVVETSACILAIGHSARDTFKMLDSKDIMMEPKSFAVGLRIMHPQEFINENAYGKCEYKLPTADYKVTYKSVSTGKERGVYSFCMCPGGYVVNASSEENMLAVNGMSYSGRDSANANSAMIVTVTPDDFGNGVLDGVEFQRKLERAAYKEGVGKIPVQLFADFKENVTSTGLGRVTPCIKGQYKLSNIRNVLPEYISEALCEGVTGCSRYIKGFDMDDAVFAGVESRTSSPVRITRNDELMSVGCAGLYPCGEGAGYAGGITSAAVDGIKIAEKIAANIDFFKEV